VLSLHFGLFVQEEGWTSRFPHGAIVMCKGNDVSMHDMKAHEGVEL